MRFASPVSRVDGVGPRSLRRKLFVGTCLPSVAAASLLLPSAAFAATGGYSSPSPSYALGAPLLTQPTIPSAVDRPVEDAAFLPQDLTARPVLASKHLMAAATSNTYVRYGDVSSTGDYAPGISTTSVGDTTIIAGSVTTSGAHSGGIVANGAGGINVTVENVLTSGAYSGGIYASGGGDVEIKASSVHTSGQHADGITALSNGGDVHVAVDNVVTDSIGTTGIIATGHNVTVDAGTVTTAGTGISAKGYGADAVVDITVTGSLTATSYIASGVAATSDGSIAIHNAGTISTYELSHGSQHLGLTSGIRADAVGDVTIDGNGSVAAHGDSAYGIKAYSQSGNIAISAGSITSAGRKAGGIYASTIHFGYDSYSQQYYTSVGGNVSIAVQNLATAGSQSIGIVAKGASTDITISGKLTTIGNSSAGIIAVAYTGDAAVHNSGSIITHYQAGSSGQSSIQSTGIQITAYGNVTVDGGGTISATGSQSAGIVAVSVNGGAINIDQGDIQSRMNGVYARSFPGGTFHYNDINISTGNITTTGSGQAASGVYVYNGAVGSVNINTSDISTQGDYAAGLLARAGTGPVTIKTGNISTSGIYAIGIAAEGQAVSVTSGNISTEDTGAIGIYAQALGGPVGVIGKIAISAGDISTKGASAVGILAAGDDIDILAGNISTAGNKSAGIIAYAEDGGSKITVDSIRTQGDSSRGIASVASADISVTAGTVATTGKDSTAILAVSEGGNATVNSAAVSTSGDKSYGIYAVAQAGNLSITSGTIATSGDTSLGILAAALSGDLSIKAGTISTAGKQAYGIYAVDLNGNISISVGTVKTTGILGDAVQAFAQYGKVDLTVGDISTTGAYSQGVSASSAFGTSVTAGNISTTGAYATALSAHSAADVAVTTTGTITTKGQHAYGILVEGGENGTISVNNSGRVSTAGVQAHGIYAAGSTAPSILVDNSGTVTVAGDDADAILVKNAGSLSITNSGVVSASGSNGSGIAGTAFDLVTTPIDLTIKSTGQVTTTGTNAVGISAVIVGDPYNVARAAETVSVSANTVTTTGLGSTGIWTRNDYGAVTIDATSVTTKGAGSIGIAAIGGGDITLQAGTVSATGNGIYASGSGTGTIALGVTGAVASSGDTGVLLVNHGGATQVTLASGSGISGALDGLRIESGTGQVSISNAGTIAGGTGYAIDLTGLPQPTAAIRIGAVVKAAAAPTPGAPIANTGTITGAVNLTAGDDTLTNSGTFVATKDSDFGAGSDSFVNTGKLVVQPGTKAGNVTLLGLEQFQNSGLIDLRNGVAGDTLTLPGNYVASGKAALGVDLGANGVTDKLVVAGSVTGTTALLINATAGNATLLAKPVTLIQAGAGSSSPQAGQPGGAMAANAFTIANQSVGFVTYGLSYNAATNSFQLSAQAGSPVYRLAKVNEGAQAIWHQSADAWSSHMAELRDINDPANRLWGQTYGKVDTRHEDRTIAVQGSNAQSYDLGYRQDYYGAQAGVDLGGHRSEAGNGVLFGVTGGYLSSHLNFRTGADRLRFETENVGGYASLKAGPLFANLLGQYVHYHSDASNTVEHWSDSFGGDGYGVEAEVGARLGGERFFAEPVASLAWQRTDLDALHALGQTLDFDHDTALTGKLGARIGGSYDLKGGASAIFYARAAYVHEFKGKGGLLFTSGGTSEDVSGSRLGDYGQGAIGVNILTSGRLSGFLEGDADIGSTYKGGGGRLGIRFKL